MEVNDIMGFIDYLEKTRRITNKVIELVPPDKFDWQYLPGKFTVADIIRHIAAIERHVFAEIAQGNKSTYKGCGKALADDPQAVLSFFAEMHRQSTAIFRRVSNDHLANVIKTVDGRETRLANFLPALVVHEIHHRAVLCIYLNLLGITSPPVLGLTEEQVIINSS